MVLYPEGTKNITYAGTRLIYLSSYSSALCPSGTLLHLPIGYLMDRGNHLWLVQYMVRTPRITLLDKANPLKAHYNDDLYYVFVEEKSR